METINVGEILKPFGILGEVKARPLTDDPSRFLKLRSVFVDGEVLKLKNVRCDNKFVYLKFAEIASRNDAERLSGKLISIDRANAVALPENTYFICDVVGCRVFFQDGESLGEITAVDSYGAADVFTVNTNNGKIVRFPFLKKLTALVDLHEKKVVIIKNEFDGVAVYED